MTLNCLTSREVPVLYKIDVWFRGLEFLHLTRSFRVRGSVKSSLIKVYNQQDNPNLDPIFRNNQLPYHSFWIMHPSANNIKITTLEQLTTLE